MLCAPHLQEHVQLVPVGLLEGVDQGGNVQDRGRGGDEFWAAVGEQLLKDSHGRLVRTRHLRHLLGVLVLQLWGSTQARCFGSSFVSSSRSSALRV